MTGVDGRRIVALGGGGFSMEPDNPLLDRFILSLVRRPSDRGSASSRRRARSFGGLRAGFYRAFSRLDSRPSDLQLFDRQIEDLESFVLAQDVIYVGGGSTANLLAVWRAHGLDRDPRAGLERGRGDVWDQRRHELLVRAVGDGLVRGQGLRGLTEVWG